MEGNLESTPPELAGKAQTAGLESLPKKSAPRYKKDYEALVKWLEVNHNSKHISESTLCGYFIYLADEKQLTGSSLMTKYSAIHRYIQATTGQDISNFRKLVEYVETKKKNHAPKKAAVFSRTDVEQFLRTTSDETDLLHRARRVMTAPNASFCATSLASVKRPSSANTRSVRSPSLLLLHSRRTILLCTPVMR